MSSDYVGGPSRSAWEGANFWQRRNPACMTHVPTVKHTAADDALNAYLDTHRLCPACGNGVKPRGFERHLRACSLYHWRNRNVPF